MSQKANKRERQEKRKAERLAAQDRQAALARRKHVGKRISIWLGAILLPALLVLLLVVVTDRSRTEETWLVDGPPGGDWSKGNPDAGIHLVEYSDFECGYCAKYHRFIKRLVNEMGDELRFTFRHYPLKMHANAELAAFCAEAAGRQGKFWEMQDLLFRRQAEWANNGKEAVEKLFAQYAARLGLSTRRFKRDLGSEAVRDKVRGDYESGEDSGVKGTPTFFLNDRKVLSTPKDYEKLKALILRTKRSLS